MLYPKFRATLLVGLFATGVAVGAKPQVIRFGVSSAGVGQPPRVSTGWTSVAQLHGYLEKEFAPDGIEVKWIFFKGQGPAVNEALANNQLDFTTLGDLPSIIGRSVGLDTRLVLVNNSRLDVYVAVAPESPINKIEDLRGKRIVFHKGTSTQLAVNRILARHGLSEKDVRVVNMEPANAKAAFLAGQVDALFGAFNLITLQEQKKARIIQDTRDLPAATSLGHVLVNQKFAGQYPEATGRVVKALVKAAHWASQEEHRDSVFNLWGTAGVVPASQYRKQYAGIPLAQLLSPLFDDFIVAHDARGVEDAFRFKLIRKTFDVNLWIDDRYLKAALRDLKLETFWPRYDKDGRLAAPKG